jgi:large subunit ribosomal protein L18
MKQKALNKIRLRRKMRVRAKIFGTSEKPRLSVFRSNRYTYAQLIDDENSRTLISASTKELDMRSRSPKGQNQEKKLKKIEQAEKIGNLIAQKAVKKGIRKAIFNRREYQYHGRVKAVAEGARKAGLQL